MNNKTICILFFAILMSPFLYGQTSPAGTWKTVDDNTGEAKSHIEVYEEGGKFYGKITKLLKSDPGTLCDECKGKKHNQPILGMVILEELVPVKAYWKNGTILDPENGKEYGCSIWFEEGKTDELRVRGKHWTGLYRTQTWFKVD